MKLPHRRQFLHLAAGAAGCVTDRAGASLSDEAGASDRAVSGGRRARSLTCAAVRQLRARDHLGDIDQPLFWCKWRRDGYRHARREGRRA